MATSITVTGLLRTNPATAATGYVRFVPTATMYDAAGNVLVTRAGIEAPLVAGAFSLVLYANNDPTTAPTGTAYKFYHNDVLLGIHVIPYNQGSPLDVADLPPATTEVYNDYVTSANLAAVKAANELSMVGANVGVSQPTPVYLFRAPAACTITYASLLNLTSFGLSDASNWKCELTRYRGPGVPTPAIIATKDTKLTNGTNSEAITAGVEWVLNAATFDPANKILQEGDLIAFFLTRIGSALSISTPQYFMKYTLT